MNNRFKPGDKVKTNFDTNEYTVYAIYSDTEVSLGLLEYPDVEQDILTNISCLTKIEDNCND